MAEDDLARLLPDPPPPRPGRRDAAIAAAMRRFDGEADPVAPVVPPRPAPPPARSWWRPSTQVGALATVVLVGLISLSVALRNPVRPPISPPDVTPTTNRANTPLPKAAASATPGSVAGKDKPAPAPSAALAQSAGPGPLARAAPADTRPGTSNPPEADRKVAAAASPPPPAEPSAEGSSSPPVAVTAMRTRSAEPSTMGLSGGVVGDRAAPAKPATRTVTNADELANRGDRDIVITGSAIRRDSYAASYAARGDWNACTVNDPEQSLRGCKSLLGLGGKGASGEAATHLSDGLTLAWRGDWPGAITAFDRAIALKPRLAIAYLNRGLAYRAQGDPDRAAADIDLAIKYAPYQARNYYNRGLLRRERGDDRGARADAERAAGMDSEYPEPVR